MGGLFLAEDRANTKGATQVPTFFSDDTLYKTYIPDPAESFSNLGYLETLDGKPSSRIKLHEG